MREDRLSRTELHYAAAEGDLEKARDLVKAGADVNARDASGWTPLHFAAQSQSEPIAHLLLGAGAVVDATDEHGNTPLFRAVFESRGDGGVIEALRAAGADCQHMNKAGVSPVKLARTIANIDVAQYFQDVDA